MYSKHWYNNEDSSNCTDWSTRNKAIDLVRHLYTTDRQDIRWITDKRSLMINTKLLISPESKLDEQERRHVPCELRSPFRIVLHWDSEHWEVDSKLTSNEMKRSCPCDDFDRLWYTGVLRVPKRGSPANFYRFIIVPRGRRRIRVEVEGTGPNNPRTQRCTYRSTSGLPQGSLPLRLYQLPFDSELRPPPMYAFAFRSVPQSPPTINTIHTKSILAPLAPDLAQCRCHVCTSLGRRAASRHIVIERYHWLRISWDILRKLNKLINQVWAVKQEPRLQEENMIDTS